MALCIHPSRTDTDVDIQLRSAVAENRSLSHDDAHTHRVQHRDGVGSMSSVQHEDPPPEARCTALKTFPARNQLLAHSQLCLSSSQRTLNVLGPSQGSISDLLRFETLIRTRG
jgi:hypothetical protein